MAWFEAQPKCCGEPRVGVRTAALVLLFTSTFFGTAECTTAATNDRCITQERVYGDYGAPTSTSNPDPDGGADEMTLLQVTPPLSTSSSFQAQRYVERDASRPAASSTPSKHAAVTSGCQAGGRACGPAGHRHAGTDSVVGGPAPGVHGAPHPGNASIFGRAASDGSKSAKRGSGGLAAGHAASLASSRDSHHDGARGVGGNDTQQPHETPRRGQASLLGMAIRLTGGDEEYTGMVPTLAYVVPGLCFALFVLGLMCLLASFSGHPDRNEWKTEVDRMRFARLGGGGGFPARPSPAQPQQLGPQQQLQQQQIQQKFQQQNLMRQQFQQQQLQQQQQQRQQLRLPQQVPPPSSPRQSLTGGKPQTMYCNAPVQAAAAVSMEQTPIRMGRPRPMRQAPPLQPRLLPTEKVPPLAQRMPQQSSILPVKGPPPSQACGGATMIASVPASMRFNSAPSLTPTPPGTYSKALRPVSGTASR
mmetsp:Transcript_122754/g.347040  ORF Transcript_122754/g.347040 Transcript_122754/m.347040 type:complete len:475 (+) Transcript_122754:122-1546(+)